MNDSAGRHRRRLYPRKFDWLEARTRHAAGESGRALARFYGVNFKTMYRVLRMSDHQAQVATEADRDRFANAMRHGYVQCPRCTNPMVAASELCKECSSALRLLDTRIEQVPGGRFALNDLEFGRVVCHNGHWGVLVQGAGRRRRMIDFWDGPPETFSCHEVVTAAPSVRVFVGDEEQVPERIES